MHITALGSHYASVPLYFCERPGFSEGRICAWFTRLPWGKAIPPLAEMVFPYTNHKIYPASNPQAFEVLDAFILRKELNW